MHGKTNYNQAMMASCLSQAFCAGVFVISAVFVQCLWSPGVAARSALPLLPVKGGTILFDVFVLSGVSYEWSENNVISFYLTCMYCMQIWGERCFIRLGIPFSLL
jgi:hypothetical protein